MSTPKKNPSAPTGEPLGMPSAPNLQPKKPMPTPPNTLRLVQVNQATGGRYVTTFEVNASTLPAARLEVQGLAPVAWDKAERIALLDSEGKTLQEVDCLAKSHLHLTIEGRISLYFEVPADCSTIEQAFKASGLTAFNGYGYYEAFLYDGFGTLLDSRPYTELPKFHKEIRKEIRETVKK